MTGETWIREILFLSSHMSCFQNEWEWRNSCSGKENDTLTLRFLSQAGFASWSASLKLCRNALPKWFVCWDKPQCGCCTSGGEAFLLMFWGPGIYFPWTHIAFSPWDESHLAFHWDSLDLSVHLTFLIFQMSLVRFLNVPIPLIQRRNAISLHRDSFYSNELVLGQFNAKYLTHVVSGNCSHKNSIHPRGSTTCAFPSQLKLGNRVFKEFVQCLSTSLWHFLNTVSFHLFSVCGSYFFQLNYEFQGRSCQVA